MNQRTLSRIHQNVDGGDARGAGWFGGERSSLSPMCTTVKGRVGVLRNFVRMVGLGLSAGFLSACAWDILMVPGKYRDVGALVLGTLLFLLPGVIYGLVISLPFVAGLTKGKLARMVETALCGGIAFFVAVLVTIRCYAALPWGALLLGGFTGSLIFGMIVSLLMRLNGSPWGLASYVVSGTMAALAFFPFSSRVVIGPNTPNLHWSVYLGFMVWQGATSVTLALFQPEPSLEDKPSKEV
jgi:hypothetical protein